MIGEGTWLDEDWYEHCEIILRFKPFLNKRGIKLTFHKNRTGAFMRMIPEYRITIRRGARDTSKISMLIHEFVHFELGHRGTQSNEEYAKQEIEACFVEHIVLWMFLFHPDPEDYIFRHAFWIPDLYRKAYRIARQLKDEVFRYGKLPANHKRLMGK